jgi:hypothetical protein
MAFPMRTMLAVAVLALAAPSVAGAKPKPKSDPLAQRVNVIVQQAAREKPSEAAGADKDRQPGKRDRDAVTLERIRAQAHEIDAAAGTIPFDARPLGK